MRLLAWILIFIMLASPVSGAPPTISSSADPILEPSGDPGSDDEWSVTDPWVGKSSNGTYYIIYSGVTPGYNYYSMMLASAPAIDGPWTKLGTILGFDDMPADLQGVSQSDYIPGGIHAFSDPYCLHDGTKWHLWGGAIPTETNSDNNPNSWQTVGERVIAHYTNSAGPEALPLTGWVLENSRSLVALSTGFTSDGSGHPAGVTSPKVYPKDGGGWVMLFCAWGYRIPDPYGSTVGYATASSLNGPWTIASEPLLWTGTAGTPYQAEQPAYFKQGTKHYMIVNRSALTTHADMLGAGGYNVSTDLWVADSQLGPYSVAAYDVLPMQEWFTNRGVVSVVNDNILTPPDAGTSDIPGIFSANMGATFKIGALTILRTSPTGRITLGGNKKITLGGNKKIRR